MRESSRSSVVCRTSQSARMGAQMCRCSDSPWNVPDSAWHPDNMTLVPQDGFRGGAFDADRFEGWMTLGGYLAAFAVLFELCVHVLCVRKRRHACARKITSTCTFAVNWRLSMFIWVAAVVIGLVYAWKGYTKLASIADSSNYCMELRDSTSFETQSACPDSGLVQNYHPHPAGPLPSDLFILQKSDER
jgi:hypothetical protein